MAACGRGEPGADALQRKIAAVRRKQQSTPAIALAPRDAATPAAPVPAPARPSTAAESPFHRKGTASAADFRPAYWRYD